MLDVLDVLDMASKDIIKVNTRERAARISAGVVI